MKGVFQLLVKRLEHKPYHGKGRRTGTPGHYQYHYDEPAHSTRSWTGADSPTGKGLRTLSLFSGVGGLDLGLAEALPEAKTVGFVEQNPFGQGVLEQHNPGVPIHADVREVRRQLESGRLQIKPNVIVGGFPCTDLSLANQEACGLDGARSGLYYEMARIVQLTAPDFVVYENVPALRSRGLEVLLAAHASMGYEIAWDGITAAGTGAPHLRDRIFVVAHRPGVKFKFTPPSKRAWSAVDWPELKAPDVAMSREAREHARNRLEAAGNAVVPAVGAHMGQLLSQTAPGQRSLSDAFEIASWDGRAWVDAEGQPVKKWPRAGVMRDGKVYAVPTADPKTQPIEQGDVVWLRDPRGHLPGTRAEYEISRRSGEYGWTYGGEGGANLAVPVEVYYAPPEAGPDDTVDVRLPSGDVEPVPLSWLHRFPTPTTTDAKGGFAAGTEKEGVDPKHEARKRGGQLRHWVDGQINPEFAEALMGFPPGHLDVPVKKPQLSLFRSLQFADLIKRLAPPGKGWEFVPRGRKAGGFRRRKSRPDIHGKKYDYWYPEQHGADSGKKQLDIFEKPAGRDARKEVTILSMGLGRDSITMLLLAKEGRLMVDGEALSGDDLDAVAFSDTGWEWPHTYALIPKIKALCKEMNVPWVHLKKPKAGGEKGWERYHATRQSRLRLREEDLEQLEAAGLMLADVAQASAEDLAALLPARHAEPASYRGKPWAVDPIGRAETYIKAAKRQARQNKAKSETPEAWQQRLREPFRQSGSLVFDPAWIEEARGLDTIQKRAEAGYYHRRAPIIEDYRRLCKITLRDSAACTTNQKILPINQRLMGDLVLEKFGVISLTDWKADVEAGKRPRNRVLIGIAADETHRLKGAEAAAQKGKSVAPRHPLVEMGITKAEEQAILDKHGFGETRKSGCVGCHFQGPDWYWALKETQPSAYEQVVEYEQAAINYAVENGKVVKYLRGKEPLDAQVTKWRERNPGATVDEVLKKEYGRKKETAIVIEHDGNGESAYLALKEGQQEIPNLLKLWADNEMAKGVAAWRPYHGKGRRTGTPGHYEYSYDEPANDSFRQTWDALASKAAAGDRQAQIELSRLERSFRRVWRKALIQGKKTYVDRIEAEAKSLGIRLQDYFASGSNHPGEIRGFSEAGVNVGVSARHLAGSAPMQRRALEELRRLGQTDTRVFVDSGAFEEVAFGPDGPQDAPGKAMTADVWDGVFEVYAEAAAALGPRALLVAPDKVADQQETLRRLTEYQDRLEELRSQGAQIIVPIQKGAQSMSDFDRAVEQLIGPDYIRGVPMKKDATTVKELREFLADRQPRRLHTLGAGSLSRLYPEINAAINELSADTVLTLDSVRITALAAKGRPLTQALGKVNEQMRAHAWTDAPAGSMDLPDYTDAIAEPEGWMTKAGKSRAVQAFRSLPEFSDGDARHLRADFDDWLQSPIDKGLPLFPSDDDRKWYEHPIVAQFLDTEWAAYHHLATTAQRKRMAIGQLTRPQLGDVLKGAWKPYHGKGRRTGTPGHYKYDYDWQQKEHPKHGEGVYYRIQDYDAPLPQIGTENISQIWAGNAEDDERRGVSVVRSIDDLKAYFSDRYSRMTEEEAEHHHFSVIALRGDLSEDEDFDAGTAGEPVLVHPVEILGARQVTPQEFRHIVKESGFLEKQIEEATGELWDAGDLDDFDEAWTRLERLAQRQGEAVEDLAMNWAAYHYADYKSTRELRDELAAEEQVEKGYFFELVKAQLSLWKPYHGKGKRTGTPGHYEYTYDELKGRGGQQSLFDLPKVDKAPSPAERLEQYRDDVRTGKDLIEPLAEATWLGLFEQLAKERGYIQAQPTWTELTPEDNAAAIEETAFDFLEKHYKEAEAVFAPWARKALELEWAWAAREDLSSEDKERLRQQRRDLPNSVEGQALKAYLQKMLPDAPTASTAKHFKEFGNEAWNDWPLTRKEAENPSSRRGVGVGPTLALAHHSWVQGPLSQKKKQGKWFALSQLQERSRHPEAVNKLFGRVARSTTEELDHWGSAERDNLVAQTTALYGDHGKFRPIDYDLHVHQVDSKLLMRQSHAEYIEVEKATIKNTIAQLEKELQALDWEGEEAKASDLTRELLWPGRNLSPSDKKQWLTWEVSYRRDKKKKYEAALASSVSAFEEQSYTAQARAKAGAQILSGKKRYLLAQAKMEQFGRDNHPTVFRGMAVPEKLLASLKKGETFAMTGCTAFSFDQAIADRYSSSEWTAANSPPGSVGVKLILQRTAEFDATVAGWHPSKTASDVELPAFEIVSGANSFRVQSITREQDHYQLHVTAELDPLEKAMSKERHRKVGLLFALAMEQAPLHQPVEKGYFSELIKAQLSLWKPYRGKGKRTGTPGHYEYTYDELKGRGGQQSLFDLPKVDKAPSPADRLEQYKQDVESGGLLKDAVTDAATWGLANKISKRLVEELTTYANNEVQNNKEYWEKIQAIGDGLQAIARHTGHSEASILAVIKGWARKCVSLEWDIAQGLDHSLPYFEKKDAIEYKRRWAELELTKSDEALAYKALLHVCFPSWKIRTGDPAWSGWPDMGKIKGFGDMDPSKSPIPIMAAPAAFDATDPWWTSFFKDGMRGELGHWGQAVAANRIAATCAYYGDHGKFRPTDKAMVAQQVPLTLGLIDQGVRDRLARASTDAEKHVIRARVKLQTAQAHHEAKLRYILAQEKMQQWNRSDEPAVFRGMALPENLLTGLKKGETLALTGCTAFSFDEAIADRYSSSDWTKGVSPADSVGCKIVLTRTQEFDETVAGWHPRHPQNDTDEDADDVPAFEIISGANTLRIDSIAPLFKQAPGSPWESWTPGAPHYREDLTGREYLRDVRQQASAAMWHDGKHRVREMLPTAVELIASGSVMANDRSRFYPLEFSVPFDSLAQEHAGKQTKTATFVDKLNYRHEPHVIVVVPDQVAIDSQGFLDDMMEASDPLEYLTDQGIAWRVDWDVAGQGDYVGPGNAPSDIRRRLESGADLDKPLDPSFFDGFSHYEIRATAELDPLEKAMSHEERKRKKGLLFALAMERAPLRQDAKGNPIKPELIAKGYFSKLSKAQLSLWKPYTGPGKRTGTPGHYEYDYSDVKGKKLPRKKPTHEGKQQTLFAVQAPPTPPAKQALMDYITGDEELAMMGEHALRHIASGQVKGVKAKHTHRLATLFEHYDDEIASFGEGQSKNPAEPKTTTQRIKFWERHNDSGVEAASPFKRGDAVLKPGSKDVGQILYFFTSDAGNPRALVTWQSPDGTQYDQFKAVSDLTTAEHKTTAKGYFSELIKASPPPGYTVAPGSHENAYRKKEGGQWVYWYPDGKGGPRTKKEEKQDVEEAKAKGQGVELPRDARRHYAAFVKGLDRLPKGFKVSTETGSAYTKNDEGQWVGKDGKPVDSQALTDKIILERLPKAPLTKRGQLAKFLLFAMAEFLRGASADFIKRHGYHMKLPAWHSTDVAKLKQKEKEFMQRMEAAAKERETDRADKNKKQADKDAEALGADGQRFGQDSYAKDKEQGDDARKDAAPQATDGENTGIRARADKAEAELAEKKEELEAHKRHRKAKADAVLVDQQLDSERQMRSQERVDAVLASPDHKARIEAAAKGKKK